MRGEKMSDDLKVWSEELDPDYENSPHDCTGEIFGKGYFCMDCKQSESFTGNYALYRIYEGDEDGYEFWSEIAVPDDLDCECGSNNIYIEYKEGWCFKFLEDENLILAGGRTLISFEDADGDCDLFKLLDADDDSISEASNILDNLSVWDFNDLNAFDGSESVLVKINAKGTIGQNEDGVYDDESTYESSMFAPIS